MLAEYRYALKTMVLSEESFLAVRILSSLGINLCYSDWQSLIDPPDRLFECF